jgi:hypothetical protein
MSDHIALFTDAADLERAVRSRDPESSWEAARITRSQSDTIKAFIREHLRKHGPQTDDQIFADYQLAGGNRTPQRLRTARAALVHPKWGEPQVREHPEPGVSNFGNTARKWVLI